VAFLRLKGMKLPTIYLDIETLETNRQDVIDEIRASIKAPGQFKKPESIAAWLEENRKSETEAEVAKTALSGAFGRVCCIGIAIDDDERPRTFHGLDEPVLLANFSAWLNSEVPPGKYDSLIVGHNVLAFDLRFLVQRYMVNGIRPPFAIARAAQSKPWEVDKVFCTMTQFVGVGNRISLDKLCRALNVESPKGDIDGSKVGEYVKAGRLEEVAEYCRKDVEATRQVYKRMTFQ